MRLSHKTLFICCAIPLFPGMAGAAVTTVDFETGNELATLFRVGTGPNYTQTANGGASNDVVNFAQGSGSASTLFYDANGAAAGVSVFAVSIGSPLIVTTSVILPSNNGSFGIFFANPANEANAYLGLFNVNYAAGNGTLDQLRTDTFFNATTGGVGSLNTGVTPDAGVTTGAAFTVTATYTILTANSYSITLAVGSASITTNYTGTPLANVEVGFRTNPISGTASLDDFTVNGTATTVIPEASTAILSLIGAAGLLSKRRRA